MLQGHRMNNLRHCCSKPTAHWNKSLLEKLRLHRKLRPAL